MKFGTLLGPLGSTPRELCSRLRGIARRLGGGGAVGVVVDHHGTILGTYLDPFADPRRPPRLHTGRSPWLGAGCERAWEGFGGSRAEALSHANRLRRRHLRLIGATLDEGPEPRRFRAGSPP